MTAGGSFVSPTMADEDPSRPIWPACPSKGWQSGVDQLTGLPNGKPLSMKASSADTGSVSAPAAVTVAAAGESDASTCTAIENVDYDKGTNWLSKPCGGKGSKAADSEAIPYTHVPPFLAVRSLALSDRCGCGDCKPPAAATHARSKRAASSGYCITRRISRSAISRMQRKSSFPSGAQVLLLAGWQAPSQ